MIVAKTSIVGRYDNALASPALEADEANDLMDEGHSSTCCRGAKEATADAARLAESLIAIYLNYGKSARIERKPTFASLLIPCACRFALLLCRMLAHSHVIVYVKSKNKKILSFFLSFQRSLFHKGRVARIVYSHIIVDPFCPLMTKSWLGS